MPFIEVTDRTMSSGCPRKILLNTDSIKYIDLSLSKDGLFYVSGPGINVDQKDLQKLEQVLQK